MNCVRLLSDSPRAATKGIGIKPKPQIKLEAVAWGVKTERNKNEVGLVGTEDWVNMLAKSLQSVTIKYSSLIYQPH